MLKRGLKLVVLLVSFLAILSSISFSQHYKLKEEYKCIDGYIVKIYIKEKDPALRKQYIYDIRNRTEMRINKVDYDNGFFSGWLDKIGLDIVKSQDLQYEIIEECLDTEKDNSTIDFQGEEYSVEHIKIGNQYSRSKAILDYIQEGKKLIVYEPRYSYVIDIDTGVIENKYYIPNLFKISYSANRALSIDRITGKWRIHDLSTGEIIDEMFFALDFYYIVIDPEIKYAYCRKMDEFYKVDLLRKEIKQINIHLDDNEHKEWKTNYSLFRDNNMIIVPESNRLWIINNHQKKPDIIIVDTESSQVLNNINLSGYSQSIAYNKMNKRIYITCQNYDEVIGTSIEGSEFRNQYLKDTSVIIFDSENYEIINEISLGKYQNTEKYKRDCGLLRFTSDNNIMSLYCFLGGVITVDTQTDIIKWKIDANLIPESYGITFSADGNYAFLTSPLLKKVTVVDMNDGSIIKEIDTPETLSHVYCFPKSRKMIFFTWYIKDPETDPSSPYKFFTA